MCVGGGERGRGLGEGEGGIERLGGWVGERDIGGDSGEGSSLTGCASPPPCP